MKVSVDRQLASRQSPPAASRSCAILKPAGCEVGCDNFSKVQLLVVTLFTLHQDLVKQVSRQDVKCMQCDKPARLIIRLIFELASDSVKVKLKKNINK